MRSFATRLATVGVAGLLAAASAAPASAATRQKRAAPAKNDREQTVPLPASAGNAGPCMIDEGYGRFRPCASGGGGGGGM